MKRQFHKAGPDVFKQYPISELHAAQLIFGVIGSDFKAMGEATAQRFCEMLVPCCEDVLERNRKSSSSGKDSSSATAISDKRSNRDGVKKRAETKSGNN